MTTDELTGLRNHRCFKEQLSQQIEKCSQGDGTFSLVFMDLAIPRLIQHIIDAGITPHNSAVIVHTSLAMLGISALSTLFAIGNNYLSVRVGESVARDLRDALFVKIQSLSFGDLDRLLTMSAGLAELRQDDRADSLVARANSRRPAGDSSTTAAGLPRVAAIVSRLHGARDQAASADRSFSA